jgi:hypothetical protein
LIDYERHIDFLIFIDARIPNNSLNGYLDFIDTNQQKQSIRFNYGQTGCIYFEEGGFEKLSSANKDGMIMHLEYSRRFRKDYQDFRYEIRLPKLASTILMIVNINKKKGTYAYDMDCDGILIRSDHKAMKKNSKLRERDY